MPVHEFSTPLWLSTVWTISGFVTYFFFFYGMFLVWCKSLKEMKQYKHILSAIVYFTAAFDIIVVFMFRPVALFPLWGGFTDSGFVQLSGQLMGWIGLLDGDATYFLLFRLLTSLAAWHVLLTFPQAILCAVARPPRELMVSYIIENHPEFIGILNHSTWVILNVGDGNIWPRVYAYCCVGHFGIYIVIGCVLIFLIVKNLNKMKEHMSEKTYKMHRNLLKSLCCQSIVPVVMYLFPIAFALLAIYLEMEDAARDLMNSLFALMGTHSMINVILMIWFIKPYRDYTIHLLIKFRILKNSPAVTDVTPVSTVASSSDLH